MTSGLRGLSIFSTEESANFERREEEKKTQKTPTSLQILALKDRKCREFKGTRLSLQPSPKARCEYAKLNGIFPVEQKRESASGRETNPGFFF